MHDPPLVGVPLGVGVAVEPAVEAVGVPNDLCDLCEDCDLCDSRTIAMVRPCDANTLFAV